MPLYFLQLLRFIAALLVLLFHLGMVHSGYKGVDVFFVISGFVMYYSLCYGSRPKAFTFIINRLTKIFFLYWVALLVLWLVLPYKIDPAFLNTFLLVPGHTAVLGVSWSLSYELYFYFAVAVVLYVLPAKYNTGLFFTLLAATTVITIINLTPYTVKGTIINFLIGPNAWEFLLGILSGALFARYHTKVSALFTSTVAVILLLLLLLIAVPYTAPYAYIVYGPLSFGIVYCITVYEKHSRLNKKATVYMQVLGDASYAIYLFGPIVTLLVAPAGWQANVLVIITTIAFSILFNRVVERNFLRWVRRVLTRRY